MAFSMTVSGTVTVNSRKPSLRRSRYRRTRCVLSPAVGAVFVAVMVIAGPLTPFQGTRRMALMA